MRKVWHDPRVESKENDRKDFFFFLDIHPSTRIRNPTAADSSIHHNTSQAKTEVKKVTPKKLDSTHQPWYKQDRPDQTYHNRRTLSSDSEVKKVTSVFLDNGSGGG
jgi:hypothetical protein